MCKLYTAVLSQKNSISIFWLKWIYLVIFYQFKKPKRRIFTFFWSNTRVLISNLKGRFINVHNTEEFSQQVLIISKIRGCVMKIIRVTINNLFLY